MLNDYFTVYSSGKFSKSIITCIAQNESKYQSYIYI